ncbi:MAG: class IV adenylate cyclase, partial [Chloroflexi bacterium]|nr:class IV adenylate cyclase [Chloroflexota bacterium]
AGARLPRARLHETNLRFDTPGGDLGQARQALRLRRGDDIRLTFKGAARSRNGVPEREEIELAVGDFENGRALLEALGYRVQAVYEKYRTAYRLGKAEALLDETPIGNFIEIEAPSAAEVEAAARALGLDWETRITDGYLNIFETLRREKGWEFGDMTFANLNRPADS